MAQDLLNIVGLAITIYLCGAGGAATVVALYVLVVMARDRRRAPATPDPRAWSRFQPDFDGMTDSQVDEEAALSMARVVEEEEWLEAVAAWDSAGRPRTGPEPEDDDDQA